MKKTFFPLLLLLGASFPSCSELGPGPKDGRNGRIVLRFAEDCGIVTRASALPDTNEFLLNVSNSKGTSIYDGKYGSAPSAFLATPGTYTVSVRSGEFKEPLYDSPQFVW